MGRQGDKEIGRIAGLDLPHLDDDKLQRCLSSALSSRISDRTDITYPYWNAAYFNLEQVKVFQNASYEQQQLIVQLANTSLLEEAYAIEKAGVGYMAKMVLLAETTQERMLYALFSADEATHLAQISQFLSQPPISQTNPFLRFLADVVESEDKTLLLFILQILLEGWGLTHYRHLAKDCLNPQLSNILHGFLQDEARHHSTGIRLFNHISVKTSSYKQIIETLALFLPTIQAGPQTIVSAIEQILGYLSRQQKVDIFAQLDTEIHSGTRLKLLRYLMQKPAYQIVEQLDTLGLFQPFTPDNCV